jgi:hypothetical protein
MGTIRRETDSNVTNVRWPLRLGAVVLVLAGLPARASESPPAAVPAPAAAAKPEAKSGVKAGDSADDADEALANGQLSTKFRINEDSPEHSVPSDVEKRDNPIQFGYFLQDLLAKGEGARKRKDFSAMVRYYRALAKAVPDQATSWSQLCEAYMLANDPAHGARACKTALERPGAELKDFTRFVSLTLQKPEPLMPPERAEVEKVLAHIAGDPALNVTVNQLRCQLAVKMSDEKALEQCTAALAKAAPDDLKTIIYQWSLAVRKGQGPEATRLLKRAQGMGLARQSIEDMRRFTPGSMGRWPLMFGVALALSLGGAGFWFFRASRKRRARALLEQVAQ